MRACAVVVCVSCRVVRAGEMGKECAHSAGLGLGVELVEGVLLAELDVNGDAPLVKVLVLVCSREAWRHLIRKPRGRAPEGIVGGEGRVPSWILPAHPMASKYLLNEPLIRSTSSSSGGTHWLCTEHAHALVPPCRVCRVCRVVP